MGIRAPFRQLLTVFIAPLMTWGLLFGLFTSCQGESIDFQNLTGEERGSIPGKFVVRLAEIWRDKIDQIQEEVESLVPGSAASLTQRFSGSDSDSAVNENGTKLSDLLSLEFPGTDSEAINRLVFDKLTKVKRDGELLFEKVDTGKFLSDKYDVDTIDDPQVDEQYYLDQISWQEAVQLDAFNKRIQKAAPVVVGVADTGVNASHEDLGEAMWEYEGYVGFDATAAGGNGQVISQASDLQGHGTHVAGIIAAIGKNNKGIHGVASISGRGGDDSLRLVEIMDLRVLNENGGGTSEIMENAIKWAVDQHRAQKAADPSRSNQRLIINMSLGGPFESKGYNYETDANGKFKFESDIFAYAVKEGDVMIIAAAGNDSCSLGSACKFGSNTIEQTYYYPCSYEGIMCVAASDNSDNIADFSNRQDSVDIAAPGYLILSSVNSGDSEYEKWNGTSMATPVTAGAAAVLWSLYPEFSGDQIETILRATEDKVTSLTGQFTSGAGRLNLKNAIEYAEELSPTKEDGSPELATPNNPTLDKEIGAPVKKENSITDQDPANKVSNTEDLKDAPVCINEPCSGEVSGSDSGCGVIRGQDQVSSLLFFILLLALPLVLIPRGRRQN